jgi:hypothetical protein
MTLAYIAYEKRRQKTRALVDRPMQLYPLYAKWISDRLDFHIEKRNRLADQDGAIWLDSLLHLLSLAAIDIVSNGF